MVQFLLGEPVILAAAYSQQSIDGTCKCGDITATAQEGFEMDSAAVGNTLVIDWWTDPQRELHKLEAPLSTMLLKDAQREPTVACESR